ncbi:MAG: cytochrome b [Proteobacteria bacterium]|nr:cytochrome b [Pseudomonadota bacterium]NCA28559.1 cytochrome b [Pseudomonadota bacterium]
MKYALSSRLLHWIMAIIIFSTLALGIYMKEFLGDDSTNRYQIYDLHKSMGMVVLILLIVRIANRFIKTPPALPSSISPLEQKLAKFGHLILYVLMLTTPISGYLMSSFAGYPVKLFSLELPNLVGTNFTLAKICAEIHEISAYALLGIVLIHILAVIKHRFFDRPENDVLKRII